MPDIIDTLKLILELDSKKLEEGGKRADTAVSKSRDTYEKDSKIFIASSQALAMAITSLAGAFAGLLAAMGASKMVQMATDAAKGAVELRSLAKELGLSVPEMDKWRIAASNAHQSWDGFQQSMRNVQRIQREIGRNKLSDEDIRLYNLIGLGNNQVPMGLSNTRGKDASETWRNIFEQLKQRAAASEKGRQDAYYIMEQLKIPDKMKAEILKYGGEFVDKFQYGIPPMTDDQSEKLNELDKHFNALSTSIAHLRDTIVAALAPDILDPFLQWLTDIANKINSYFQNPPSYEEFQKQLRERFGPSPLDNPPHTSKPFADKSGAEQLNERWQQVKPYWMEPWKIFGGAGGPGRAPTSDKSTGPSFGAGGFGGGSSTQVPTNQPGVSPSIIPPATLINPFGGGSSLPGGDPTQQYNFNGGGERQDFSMYSNSNYAMLGLSGNAMMAGAHASVWNRRNSITNVGNLSINSVPVQTADHKNIGFAPQDFTDSLLGAGVPLLSNSSLV